jgi:catechol-2,3-dioxygenase
MSRRLDPEPLVRPARFAHFVLRTRKLEESIAWYETVVGMEIVFRNEFVAFLSYDEEHHRIMIGRNPNATPRDPKAAGVVHFAYAVETLEDLVGIYLRLEDAGILPHNCLNHGFTTSLYYRDPDGNEAEYQVDNYRSREAMDAWFRTGAFDRNFVGHRFDPEYMVERFRAGVDEDQILQKDLYR